MFIEDRSVRDDLQEARRLSRQWCRRSGWRWLCACFFSGVEHLQHHLPICL